MQAGQRSSFSRITRSGCRGAAAIGVSVLLLGAGSVCADAIDTDALVMQAFAHLDTNEPEQALALFKQAAQADPNSAELLTYVGLGHYKTGQPRAALHAFESVRLRDASLVDASFLFYRASSMRSLGLSRSERKAWAGIACMG